MWWEIRTSLDHRDAWIGVPVQCYMECNKEGERNYAAVNPHNFRSVLTNEQLASSLQATILYSLVL